MSIDPVVNHEGSTVAFLSDEYFAAAQSAIEREPALAASLRKLKQPLVIQQTVTDCPDGTARVFHWRLDPESFTLATGAVPDADTTITLDYATAAAIDQGKLSRSVALMKRRLQVQGSVRMLMAAAKPFRIAEQAMKSLRVTY